MTKKKRLYVGDHVIVTSTEGVYEGYLVTRAQARPLVLSDIEHPENWFGVLDVQKVKKVDDVSDYDELVAHRDAMVAALATTLDEKTATHTVDTLLNRIRRIEESEKDG